MMQHPTAVVVAYGALELLEQCLPSLAGLRVIVVDNSSSPSARAVSEVHGAKYIDPGGNLGFAAAVNIALACLDCSAPTDVLLLNPDAVLARGAAASLTAFLRQPGNERVAAVSPRLVDSNGCEQRVEWPFPSPARAWLEAFGLGRLSPGSGSFLVGAALLLRAEALRDIGGFDERFFLYAEETDWQRRAARRKWEVRMLPDVTVEHSGGGTSADPKRREALFHAGQETYIRKWYGPVGWSVYRCAQIFAGVTRAVLLRGERRRVRWRAAILYVRGPRRVAGFT